MSSKKTSAARFAQGQRSDIELVSSVGGVNWIRKESNDSNESMSWKFDNMIQLAQAGLGPKVVEKLFSVEEEVQWFLNERLDTYWTLCFEDKSLGEPDFGHAG